MDVDDESFVEQALHSMRDIVGAELGDRVAG